MKDKSLKNLGGLVVKLALPYKKWLVIILIAMVLETIMGLALPWPLKITIDNVINGEGLRTPLQWLSTWFPGKHSVALAVACGIALVLITALGGLGSYINNYYTERSAQYMANDLRRRIYHHLQHLSLAYYDTHQVGKLLSTITDDVNIIRDFISSTLLNIFIDGLTILGMICLMLSLKWDFALIAVSLAPFLLLFTAHFKQVVKKTTHEVRRQQAEMMTVIQHGLESIRSVNVFGRQNFEEDHLQTVSMNTVNASLKARRIKSFISPVFTLGVALCMAFVLWRGAILVLANAMTIGVLTVYLSYLNKFFSPLKDLAKMTANIAQAKVALERIQQILEADMMIPEKPGATDPGRLKGNIIFDHVCFSYKPGIQVLDDVSFTIRAGERIGICGPTGGGKSTIASLILRLYDPSAGKIFIDGSDIRNYMLEALRREIGFVLQDTMLFFGSVRDNIAYGKPNATEEEVIEAARLANAAEFICNLPLGYNTIIGERGITLSGGERQRIGIARALIRNAPILVLDEPTASLDSEAENIVCEALDRLMQGRTVIIISHRLNILLNADKIFVIKDGKVVEEGTHGYLLSKGNVYADLYRLNSSKYMNVFAEKSA